MTTCGTEADFKHFVPRLVERCAMSSEAWLRRDKLAYAQFTKWPEGERRAVEAYLSALWAERLRDAEHPLPNDPLLETMLALDLDIAPYDPRSPLEAWRNEGSPASMEHLAWFVLEYGPELFWPSGSGRGPTVFRWRYDLADDLRAWLLAPETRDRLEQSFLEHGGRDVARAFDWLEQARTCTLTT